VSTLHPTAASSYPSLSHKTHHPTKLCAPSIPRWLIEGVSWTPESIPAELLVEPPPLTEFKVRRERVRHVRASAV
jgi:hypothetical protein